MIQPLGNRVLVEVIEKKDRSDGGIIMPDNSHVEAPQELRVVTLGTGKVIHEGPEITRLPFDVQVGDIVMTGHYAGMDVKVKGRKHKVIEVEHIVAIVSED